MSRDLAVVGTVAITIAEMAFFKTMTIAQITIPALLSYAAITKAFKKKLDG